MAEKFISAIMNISEKKGYYFNSNFMHKNLWIYELKVNYSIAKYLCPHIEILKSTKVINSNYCKKNTLYTEDTSLYGKLSFCIINKFIVDNCHFEIPKSQDEEEKVYGNENNEISNIFHRVSYFTILSFSFENSISILNDIGKNKIQLDNLLLRGESLDECEILTNPEYFKGGVCKFTYYLKEHHSISTKFYENINKINPKSLFLQINFRLKWKYDVIKALRCLNKNIN